MIDKHEVLRYLGYNDQKIDEQIDAIIDVCIQQTIGTCHPSYTSREFSIQERDNRIDVLGTNLILEGNSIADYLRGAKRCILLAATLGIQIENLIRIKEKTDMTQALIIDACCTDYIEKVCDKAQKDLGDFSNFRFSPGYGDLSLRIQPMILNILNAQKTIGLTVTENLIMIPRKSVTAIIGIFDGESAHVQTKCYGGKCEACSMNDRCNFRKTKQL